MNVLKEKRDGEKVWLWRVASLAERLCGGVFSKTKEIICDSYVYIGSVFFKQNKRHFTPSKIIIKTFF